MGFNPGLNLSPFFCGFSGSAIKGHFFILSDNGLVAAAGKGNVQRRVGKLIGFTDSQRLIGHTDTDTQGHLGFFFGFRLPDFIEDTETLFFHGPQFFFFKNH
ncbi:hypothetical protein SDC9_159047 [bioreactor metagenome]|uniref:Uncharacterized protein n=1 Tax=bioreactor metagenome TaxID=1076179 RepID=A0A645FEG7_9ZZZZ